MSTIKTLASRTIGGIKQTWGDMDYAQRRMLEIRLGIPLDEQRIAETSRADLESLETLWRTSPR